jgi:hypothetical protein
MDLGGNNMASGHRKRADNAAARSAALIAPAKRMLTTISAGRTGAANLK